MEELLYLCIRFGKTLSVVFRMYDPLAQLVQSACFTRKRSRVQISHGSQNKFCKTEWLCSFFLIICFFFIVFKKIFVLLHFDSIENYLVQLIETLNIKKMTKAEIVAEIAQKTGIEKVAIQATVEEFMGVVKDSLTRGENVYLRGFGSFIIKKRAEKTGRNISKNTTIIIPAHNIPAFKPAKTFVNDVKKSN